MIRSSRSLCNHSQLSQENETLEEDIRKAEESAELLRSVLLALEEEISNDASRIAVHGTPSLF
jgi:hypothetical protein